MYACQSSFRFRLTEILNFRLQSAILALHYDTLLTLHKNIVELLTQIGLQTLRHTLTTFKDVFDGGRNLRTLLCLQWTWPGEGGKNFNAGQNVAIMSILYPAADSCRPNLSANNQRS